MNDGAGPPSRWFGLPPRVVRLTTVCTLCLATYHPASRSVPRWFIRFLSSSTGFADAGFHEHVWRHLMAFTLLLVVPFAHARWVERLAVRDFGLAASSARRMFIVGLGVWLALLPVLWLASGTDEFARAYPRLRAVTHDPELFVWFHLIYGLKWIAWEFFFRGVLWLGLRKDLGAVALLISTVPYTIVHFGKPLPEVYASFFFGALLCWMAVRAHSIWPAVVLHWLVSVSIELFAVDFW